MLQGHHEHRVRVFAKLHKVWHPPDELPFRRFSEGRLVDWAKDAFKAVIGPVKLSTCVDTVGFGPPFVLRSKNFAGSVSKPDECGKTLSRERPMGSKCSSAV